MPQQQSLFDTEPLPWEADDAAQQVVATVVLSTGPPGEFDYLVPVEMRNDRSRDAFVEPGRRLRVPMGKGNRLITAYCVRVETKPSGSRKLKSVAIVIDSVSLLSPAMLRLTHWMAEYYLCPWGQVLEAVVPSGVRVQAGTRDVTLLFLPTKVAARLTQLDVTDTQRKVLETLATSPKPLSPPELARIAKCSMAPIQALRKLGLIDRRMERLDTREVAAEAVAREPAKQLHAEQERALATILAAFDSGKHQTILVHGVTGSGKTEVYIQAIEKAVSFGRQAIVLVPEISLTPQTVGRFRERFDRVAVLHSHQSDVERHRHWRRIVRGEVEVVVGARSAIFAPLPHLGLIIIDEEHESSFKQDSAPRYHARDVAIERAMAEGVPLVLGSATPSLESWQHAASGDYSLVEMPRRVLNLPMPTVRTIDLREETHRRTGSGAISRPLSQAMEAALRDDGQVILLLNRRGFSTHVQCPACGFVLKCPDCDVALTFHRHDNAALCHWCDFHTAPPDVCPDCKNANIRYSGQGTQKLEAEVRARFPQHECLRMDTDTMRRPGSHEAALTKFRAGDVRILLGTQMIAKGLDFPNVTLVGVINADTALHWPDFRAAERTFHLVTQVAGRTGRSDRGGRVLVQTFSPEHPAILAAVKHDYRLFAAGELPQREALGYPPFGSMVRIIVRGEQDATTKAFAERLGELVTQSLQRLEVPHRMMGPAPAPIAKLRGKYRYHIQLQSPDADGLRRAVRPVLATATPPEEVQWIVDVDPIDMM
ncbi:MAG: primosomal protein N' [Pirellulales bacterium]